jgi:NDP-sugar pyrophosphorylase family protein
MRPFTDEYPKSMLPVAGRPFLHYQLDWLAAEGIDEVVYCLGYRGEMIRDYVGDGGRWGLKATYVDEGAQLRGTAGAVRLALDAGVLDPAFALLYGDSFIRLSIPEVWARFEQSQPPALMTVIRNEGQWDRSNASYENGRVIAYDKAAQDIQPPARYIDYGFSVLTSEVVEQEIPQGTNSDLAALFHALKRPIVFTRSARRPDSKISRNMCAKGKRRQSSGRQPPAVGLGFLEAAWPGSPSPHT